LSTVNFATAFNEKAEEVHKLNKKWWVNIKTGEPLDRNRGEMLMLMVSEIAEAMEGDRKGLQDDHLPGRKMVEVELADCVIRILDYAAGFGLDVGGAIEDKLEYNKHRADHKIENRLKDGGKKY
jgi:NTP pyrophosphatase (non-canonical NTP hydrolase)